MARPDRPAVRLADQTTAAARAVREHPGDDRETVAEAIGTLAAKASER